MLIITIFNRFIKKKQTKKVEKDALASVKRVRTRLRCIAAKKFCLVKCVAVYHVVHLRQVMGRVALMLKGSTFHKQKCAQFLLLFWVCCSYFCFCFWLDFNFPFLSFLFWLTRPNSFIYSNNNNHHQHHHFILSIVIHYSFFT